MQCVNSTVKDVSSKEQVPYDAIEGMIDHYINATVDWSAYETLEILGIDEIALRKGHRNYIVIVTTRLRNGAVRLLAVLPDRTKATVLSFFRGIPYRLRRTVTDVCSDMYEAYLTAVEEVFGADMSVIDRFHVAQHYYEAADDLRKEEMARLKRERKKSEYELLKGVMWYFRRRPADITRSEKDVLACLFSAAPRLQQAYELREELTTIFETPYTKTEAIEQLRRWSTKVEKSGLTCFEGFLKLLTHHMNGIANYFRNRYTSGFVEGLNNRIKVLKRRCYGIFNLKRIFQRITLDLDGYAVFGHASPTTK
jgi:transposase